MKTYLPGELINSRYSYYVNGNNIVVKTDNNCYYQYQTQYCDCKEVYTNLDYLTTDTFSCSLSNHNINYSSFTDNYYYKLNFDKTLVIFIIIAIFAFYFPYRVFSRLFGRWLKW